MTSASPRAACADRSAARVALVVVAAPVAGCGRNEPRRSSPGVAGAAALERTAGFLAARDEPQAILAVARRAPARDPQPVGARDREAAGHARQAERAGAQG